MTYNLMLQKALDYYRIFTYRWEGKLKPFKRPKDVQIKWVEEIKKYYITFRLYNCKYGYHFDPSKDA